ncbi:MAG: hypothetical protein ACOZCO_15870 [Bacteroidota bacterium]
MKKVLFYALILLSIEALLIWLWIHTNQPDPSSSIVGMYLIPVIFILHLFAGIFLFFYTKPWGKSFIINAFLSPVVFWIFWDFYLNDLFVGNYEHYIFSYKNKSYTLIVPLDTSYDNMFYLDESTGENSFTSIDAGRCFIKNDTIFLQGDSISMKIFNSILIGFPEKDTKIEMGVVCY